MRKFVVYLKTESEEQFSSLFPELVGHPDLDPIGPLMEGDEVIDPNWHGNLFIRGENLALSFSSREGVIGGEEFENNSRNLLFGTPPETPFRCFAGY